MSFQNFASIENLIFPKYSKLAFYFNSYYHHNVLYLYFIKVFILCYLINFKILFGI